MTEQDNLVLINVDGAFVPVRPAFVEFGTTTSPDGYAPTKLTPEPIRIEAELAPDDGKKFRAMLDALHLKTINNFAQACLDGELTNSVMRRVAEALGVEFC